MRLKYEPSSEPLQISARSGAHPVGSGVVRAISLMVSGLGFRVHGPRCRGVYPVGSVSSSSSSSFLLSSLELSDTKVYEP